jgi:polygalacturonase
MRAVSRSIETMTITTGTMVSICLSFLLIQLNAAPPLSEVRIGSNGSILSIDVTTLGAKGDGNSDDGIFIQQAIDMLPDSGGVVYLPVPFSSYRIIRTISVIRKNGVIIRGDNAPVTLSGFIGIGFSIVQSSHCTVSGLKIIGQNTMQLGANAAAIKVSRSSDILLENNVIEGAVTNGIEGFRSSHCIVRNNVVRGTRNYNGIGWAGGEYNLFSRNTCMNNRGQGIEIRSQHHAEVIDNVCMNNGTPG